ncbi:hypothetical protein AGRA3207_002296 [Actinomadura graeca]|uniref:Uncharacterized protein n=1 Tax=Actinomadura graeca TaxID=2750812 RepID=A0ABX8QXF6_9ACTN|nr:hypothetical protein [Actinomadura graeca]QXJ21443.1 hypothetical protein AGRA3207_002296 [Actinomadura graeca]
MGLTPWRRRPVPLLRGRRHARTREKLERFLDGVYPGGVSDAGDKLKLIILGILLQHPDHDRVIACARRRGLDDQRTRRFLRGEVASGFRHQTLAGLLGDCDADPVTIEVAMELFEVVIREEAGPRRPVRPGPAPPSAPSAPSAPASSAASDAPSAGDGENGAAEPAVRDRVPGGPPEPEPDEPGPPASKPDPGTAATASELMALLRAYRLWTGKRSYRKMSAAIDHRYAHTTLSGLPRRTTLSTLDIFLAYIEGCGGDPADLGQWKAAWQRIAVSDASPPEDGEDGDGVPGPPG